MRIKFYYLLLLVLASTTGCDVFLHDVGTEGQPCRDNGICNDELVCELNKCCRPAAITRCGADGNVHEFSSCANEGALVQDCLDCEKCINTSDATAECRVIKTEDHQQCGQDGNVYWFDTCDKQGPLVSECPKPNVTCRNIAATTAECWCPGNWDPDQNCSVCKNHWVNAGNDCGTCPGNWDSTQNCNVCKNHWMDNSDNCGTCPGNWDPDQNCNVCKTHWVDDGNNCGTCPGNWDPNQNCNICTNHWEDNGNDCGTCPGNWDPAQNCNVCKNQWIDESNQCGTCPVNWDASRDCGECEGNWDITQGCLACKNHWVDSGNDCTTCPGHWDPAQDCNACLSGWANDNNECGTCIMLPSITAINGSGTEVPIGPRPEDMASWDQHESDRIPATRRVSSIDQNLVIDGANFGNLASVIAVGQTGQGTIEFTIEEEGMNTIKAKFPANLAIGAGLFILTVATTCGEANAQVFFLQGQDGVCPKRGNVVTVAIFGGDFSSIQSAIDSITDESASNPYTVRVEPGTYTESVIMTPYIRLQGAGLGETIITSSQSSASSPPTTATVTMASNATISELTVENIGTGSYSAAVLVNAGNTGVLIDHIRARSMGTGGNNLGVAVIGTGTNSTIKDIDSLAASGTSENIGIYFGGGSSGYIDGGNSYATGPGDAFGVYVTGTGTKLEGRNHKSTAQNGSNSAGLNNEMGASAVLSQCTFTGIGGADAQGIRNQDPNTYLEANDVTSIAMNGTTYSQGLSSGNSSVANLYGGSFQAIGSGGSTYGINNRDAGTSVAAYGVFINSAGAAGEGDGFFNADGGSGVIHQSFVGGVTYSIRQSGAGDVIISNSRIGSTVYNGVATCVGVSRAGTFLATGCP